MHRSVGLGASILVGIRLFCSVLPRSVRQYREGLRPMTLLILIHGLLLSLMSAAVQDRRVSGSFILITGQDGIRCAVRPNQVAMMPMNATTRAFFAYTAGTSSGCRARWKRL